ncbi:hydroxyproline-rich glycoprotein DZ-HRGP [Gracilaria domingensis]|nr:hydroxyproline-rich glycoprotein DZ-HRGP [Gracilaria domingensis]
MIGLVGGVVGGGRQGGGGGCVVDCRVGGGGYGSWGGGGGWRHVILKNVNLLFWSLTFVRRCNSSSSFFSYSALLRLETMAERTLRRFFWMALCLGSEAASARSLSGAEVYHDGGVGGGLGLDEGGGDALGGGQDGGVELGHGGGLGGGGGKGRRVGCVCVCGVDESGGCLGGVGVAVVGSGRGGGGGGVQQER